MKKRELKIYDNGGKTVDRYTVVFFNCPIQYRDNTYRISYGKKTYPVVGMSNQPYDPQGFCQHVGEYGIQGFRVNSNWGKRIKLEDCPEDVQHYINHYHIIDEEEN